MRLLGIDYGTKRIGFATGDTEVSLAFPLRTVTVEGDKTAMEAVSAVVREERPDLVVVGVPHRLAGGAEPSGTQAAAAAFAEALASALDVPVETEDERFTSAIADRLRQDAGTAKKNFDRDAMAAAAILETYMQRHREV